MGQGRSMSRILHPRCPGKRVGRERRGKAGTKTCSDFPPPPAAATENISRTRLVDKCALALKRRMRRSHFLPAGLNRINSAAQPVIRAIQENVLIVGERQLWKVLLAGGGETKSDRSLPLCPRAVPSTPRASSKLDTVSSISSNFPSFSRALRRIGNEALGPSNCTSRGIFVH